MMKRFTQTILALVMTSIGHDVLAAKTSDSEESSVVVIFIDDMGFADPSCFSGTIENLTFKYPNGT